jgi:hypothetical protein
MGEWRYNYSIFNLGTRWRWVVSFTLDRFIPGESPDTHWIGSWLGPRRGLDAMGDPLPERNPPAGLYPVAIPTVLPRP